MCAICGHGANGDGVVLNPKSSNPYSLKCFGCHFSGDVIAMKQEELGIDFDSAVRVLAQQLHIPIEMMDEPSERKRVKKPAQTEPVTVSADYSEYYQRCRERLTDPRAVEYLTSRGISLATAQKYDLGFDPAADPANAPGAGDDEYKLFPVARIIIPTSVKHYVARVIDDSQVEPKYRKQNAKGSTPGVFNGSVLRESSPVIFVTEGPFDALSVLEVGQTAVAINSANNVNTLLTELEARKPLTTFVICLDADGPGQRATESLCQGLENLGIPFIRGNISGNYKDPSEALQYDRDGFVQAVKEAALIAEQYAIDEQASPTVKEQKRCRRGDEYAGDLVIEYLWEPYFPRNEFVDVFGKSGSGKTFMVALVCASTTTGMFPTETKAPGTVLYISGEETFDEIADRISRAGGDLSRVTIIDRSDSVGLDFDSGFSEFSKIVKSVSPDLLVCDPWQCFVGERVDLNRQNMTRPLMQKISLLAQEAHCCVTFIAHVNKAQFVADANDALSGSSEIINAARSAIRVIEDETDENVRICVQTKSNHRKRGQSLKYRFLNDRIVWDGFSDITKDTLEQASRNRKTPLEALQMSSASKENHSELVNALVAESYGTEKAGTRITYDEFRGKYGDHIFSGRQPKRALSELIPELQARDVLLKSDIDIRRGTKHARGFYIQRMPET